MVQELQMEITLMELASCYYVFICLVDMNVFVKYDESPSITFQDIKETVYEFSKANKNYKGKLL